MIVDSTAERFHAHLERCPRCEQHPFDLCAYGRLLLEQAAAELLAAGATTIQADPEERPE